MNPHLQRQNLSFKVQESNLSLREALVIHRAHIPELIEVAEEPQGALQELFAGHDVVHCLWGLGTSVGEEIRVDLYSLFGTTIGLKRYWGYITHPTVATLIKETTPLAAIPSILLSIGRAPWIWWKTRRITRWNFDEWRSHLDRPLTDIRAGIWDSSRLRTDGQQPRLKSRIGRRQTPTWSATHCPTASQSG